MAHSPDLTDISQGIQLLGEILDASETGLIVQSSTANLVANTTALRILGVDEAALLRMTPGAGDWQARHADGRPLASEEFPGIQALRSGRPVTDQVFSLVEQAGGQRRWISVSVVPKSGTQTVEPVLYCVFKDVSESVQRNEFSDRCREEAQAASHIKDDFLAMLSHEMRTPLNGIMGMLQLSLHSRNRDSIQEYLTVALESSKHLLRLLADINEIASSDTASLQIKQESFDLESAISPTIASFVTRAKNKGLEVSCRIDPRLSERLWGDADRIRQLVFNLLTNALKQTEDGKIDVLVSPLAEYDSMKRHGLHIFIGIDYAEKTGISPEPFGQAEFDATYGASGMGLGISTVKRLAKILGGEVVVSFQQNKGSEVRVLLPLQARQEAQQDLPAREIREKAAAQSGPVKILVVEDEPINLKTMLLSLQLLGCKGIGADSAYKGLALLRREKFDAVLMDIQMPGLDGLEATRLIRGDTSGALDANIPIVAITAHAMQGDKERILKAGVDEYLAKPVYLEQLRGMLSKVLKRPLELQSK
ncbi:MAG: response regulator [Desulfovibrionaceae bacterium]|nr:response regulator [Desulfovibrionaceae bacterium]